MSESKEENKESPSSYVDVLGVDPEEFIDNIEREFDAREHIYEMPVQRGEVDELAKQLQGITIHLSRMENESQKVAAEMHEDMVATRRERMEMIKLITALNEKVERAESRRSSRHSTPVQQVEKEYKSTQAQSKEESEARGSSDLPKVRPTATYTASAENPYAFTPLADFQRERPARRETMFSKIDEEPDVERLSFKYDNTRAMTEEQREQMRKSILHSPRAASDTFGKIHAEAPSLPPKHTSQPFSNVENQKETKESFIPRGGQPMKPVPPRPLKYGYSPSWNTSSAGEASGLPTMAPGGGHFPRPPPGTVPPPPPPPPSISVQTESPQQNSPNLAPSGYAQMFGQSAIPNPTPGNPFGGISRPMPRAFGDVGMLDKISDALANPLHGTYMTQMLPSYEHIMLKSLTPRSVIAYVQAVYDYVSQYNVAFKLTSRIETNVRDCIISRNAAILDEYNFHTLDNQQVVKILQYTVRPRSKDEFIENMQKYVKFRQIGEGAPDNFQNFYDALSRYRRLFVFYYEFMSENNAENVPHCNTKRNGLIHMFTNEIPSGYGQNRSNVLKQQKFTDIKQFIECFWVEVEEDYRRSKDLKILQMGFDKASPHQAKGDDDGKNSSTKKPWPQKKPVLGQIGSEAPPAEDGDSDLKKGAESEEEPTLPPIEEEEEQTLPPSDLFGEEDPDYDRKEKAEETPDVLGNIQPRAQDRFLSKGQTGEKRPGSDKQTPRDGKRGNTGSSPPVSQKEGCYYMFTSKGCDKKDCKFSHKPEDLHRTWMRLSEMVAESASKYGSSKKPDERKPGGDHGY